MPISFPNTMNIIDDALFCSTPLTISYSDPDQIWIIRKHLETLFQEFPSLEPSVGVFTNNDGKDVNLLKASGELHVSPHAPPVPLTIWVHELYPQMAPFVYISYQIYKNYPNADSSGAITSSYLQNWNSDISNLSGLARNLIELFSLDHPFYDSGRAHPSSFTKMDRMAGSIHDNKGNLAAAQLELKESGESLDIVMRKLNLYDEEKVKLDSAVADCVAADSEMEDWMYVLDEELKEGGVKFDDYMKKVRALARKQFLYRARKRKIERPDQGFLFD